MCVCSNYICIYVYIYINLYIYIYLCGSCRVCVYYPYVSGAVRFGLHAFTNLHTHMGVVRHQGASVVVEKYDF